MRLPSLEEINIYDSLDERLAAEQFLGKSIPEAVGLFREHSNTCTDYLCQMGPYARLFYLEAYLQYLASEDSRGDTCAANGLPSVVNAVMESGLDTNEVQESLLVALQRVHSQFARYAPDRLSQRIYRHLPRQVKKAILTLRRRIAES